MPTEAVPPAVETAGAKASGLPEAVEVATVKSVVKVVIVKSVTEVVSDKSVEEEKSVVVWPAISPVRIIARGIVVVRYAHDTECC
jgi:hypothetical protein